MTAVEKVESADGVDVPESNLEVTEQLARNNQNNGCLDGEYYFDDGERAKSFAVLALDFVVKLAEKRTKEVEEMESGSQWRSAPRD